MPQVPDSSTESTSRGRTFTRERTATAWAVRVGPVSATLGEHADIAQTATVAGLAALGNLRRFPELQAACEESLDEHGAAVRFWWVRGGRLTTELDSQLRTLPVGERFDIAPNGQLIPHGCHLPVAQLPALNWQPIVNVLQPELPATSFAGQIERRAGVRLVRGLPQFGTTQLPEPNVMTLPFSQLAAWAHTAPLIRLQQLKFAVCRRGTDFEAVVQGEPLPSIAGRRWFANQELAVPLGWRWSPAIPAQILVQQFEQQPGDLLLWDETGLERVPASEFVLCSRGAIVATQEHLQRLSTTASESSEDWPGEKQP